VRWSRYNPVSLNSSSRFFAPFLNPHLAQLQPYPFERLRALFGSVAPRPRKPPISLSIGEPRHPTPQLLLDALAAGAKGLANYPTTAGTPALREAIAGWLERRHGLTRLDPATQVLPVLGSREALFSFAQAIIDSSRAGATVVVQLSDLRGRGAPGWRDAALRQHSG
jgi:N-succinyldiaminopimelate aminotransferase